MTKLTSKNNQEISRRVLLPLLSSPLSPWPAASSPPPSSSLCSSSSPCRPRCARTRSRRHTLVGAQGRRRGRRRSSRGSGEPAAPRRRGTRPRRCVSPTIAPSWIGWLQIVCLFWVCLRIYCVDESGDSFVRFFVDLSSLVNSCSPIDSYVTQFNFQFLNLDAI